MLFTLVYNCIIFLLAVVSLPYLLYQRLRFGKYKDNICQRLGFSLPSYQKKEGERLVWIHTISMGEAIAASPFYHKLKEEYPLSKVVISTVTETGMAQAKKKMAGADAYFFLPLDFSWNLKRLVKKLKPDLFILTESDLWFQMIYQSKKSGAKCILINGKLSDRSFHRFSNVGFFFKKMLGCFDLLCVQSEQYRDRFHKLGAFASQIKVTGNIKLDSKITLMSDDEKKAFSSKLGIQNQDKIVTLGSTHFPEEEMILSVLDPIVRNDPHFKILIAPRHPERFQEVERLLKKKMIPYALFSQLKEPLDCQAKVVLIDAMGVLTKCYQISSLAIVCGSYTDRVGGHNIFEPVLLGTPVFFGPHMFSQRDLRDLIKTSKAGKQVSLEDLKANIEVFFSSIDLQNKMKRECISMQISAKGATEKTWNFCFPTIEKGLEEKK